MPDLRRSPWAWGAALLLHVLIVGALLLLHERPPPESLQDQPSLNLVIENGGTGQTATSAPPSQYHDAMQQASSPPQQAASASAADASQDEVQMPPLKLSDLPRPQPSHHESRRAPTEKSVAARHGYVLLNGMSYGNVSPVAPPAPPAPRGMNLSVQASNWQSKSSSNFTVKGDPGADWGLEKWVQEHAYYPQAAAEQGQQGTAVVVFTVDRHGHVTGVKLVSSSHSVFLDQALYQLFADNTLPAFPADATSDHVQVQFTMHYILEP